MNRQSFHKPEPQPAVPRQIVPAGAFASKTATQFFRALSLLLSFIAVSRLLNRGIVVRVRVERNGEGEPRGFRKDGSCLCAV